MENHVVILAGGAGTRLWPASDRRTPKQFLEIPPGRTLIARTYERARSLVPADRIWVVTLASQAAATRRALPKIAPTRILAEPVGRNSAPAALFAALAIQSRRRKACTLLVLPADHYIPDRKRFAAVMRAGLSRAAEGESLVTFGIRPASPHTGYGYIEARTGRKHGGALKVRRFVEKPSLERAWVFLKSGRFFWNSGMFAWRTDLFLTEMVRYAPKVALPLASLPWDGKVTAEKLRVRYSRLPDISIDYALMEKSRRVEVLPADFAWSDVGNWNAVHEVEKKDAAGNACSGRGRVVGGKGNLVRAGKTAVYLFGVDDLVVVEGDSGLLITTRAQSNDLKKFLSRI